MRGSFVILFVFLYVICVAAVGDDRLQSDLCLDPVATCDSTIDYFETKIIPEFLQEITLQYSNTYVSISIPSVSYNAVVVRCGCDPPSDLQQGTHVIYTPAKPVYMYETPTIAFAAVSLDLVEKIAAIQTVKIVSSQAVRDAVDAGLVLESDPTYELFNGNGHGGLIDPEIIPVLPSMAFIGVFGSGAQGAAPAFESQTESKIEYMPVAEPFESTPLGRAEWVKVVGLVLGVTEQANTVFSGIRSRYESTKQLVSGSTLRPSVATNGLFGSSWFFSGTNTYIGEYISDAGAVQNVDSDTNNPLTASEALERYSSARYWINYPSLSTDSVDDVLNEDPSDPKTYENMESAMCSRVSTNTRRLNPSGTGSDFFESGIASPDVVLLDLVTVLHPEVPTSHSLVYYKELEPSLSLVCPNHLKDLSQEIPNGMNRADLPFSVVGIDRFVIESRALQILESVSNEFDDSVSLSVMNLLFRETVDDNAKITVRIQTSTDVIKEVSRAVESIRSAIESSLKTVSSNVTVNLDGSIEFTPDIESSSGLSGGAIAGIVIGSVIAVILIGVAVFLIIRNKTNSKIEKVDPANVPTEEGAEVL
uniref:Fe/B12 periplasmic-binding domain-containing protein n=1 Tax=Timspurckia oligopyrenoides TaxID=708627 RepID=A0A7S0ZBV3_9RHOD|mmetsp:Transcript_11630/g.21048  ORF Transcript_11630/g.21048 Transcript_11630/m.21048 type:complete len:591 (+) Transcript_11630:48-1820(+)